CIRDRFHDDVTFSDYEDASPDALKAYAKQGLPTDLAKIRENDQDLQKWTAYKTKYLDDFAMQLVEDVRQYEPFLLT
ncbi:poly-beta-1,6-N-acetyl-D-glucosamine N-deacetylase PgaB, partial [Acinetobacter baumannii]